MVAGGDASVCGSVSFIVMSAIADLPPPPPVTGWPTASVPHDADRVDRGSPPTPGAAHRETVPPRGRPRTCPRCPARAPPPYRPAARRQPWPPRSGAQAPTRTPDLPGSRRELCRPEERPPHPPSPRRRAASGWSVSLALALSCHVWRPAGSSRSSHVGSLLARSSLGSPASSLPVASRPPCVVSEPYRLSSRG